MNRLWQRKKQKRGGKEERSREKMRRGGRREELLDELMGISVKKMKRRPASQTADCEYFMVRSCRGSRQKPSFYDSTIQDLFHVATNHEFRIQTVDSASRLWCSAVRKEESEGRKEGSRGGRKKSGS